MIADEPVTWTCQCGAVCFTHHDVCAKCSTVRVLASVDALYEGCLTKGSLHRIRHESPHWAEAVQDNLWRAKLTEERVSDYYTK